MGNTPTALDNRPSFSECISLRNPICALKLSFAEASNEVTGLLTNLAAGTSMYVCGTGFNDRTVKVMVNGQYYYVFLRDID
jgi:hypothetical protein